MPATPLSNSLVQPSLEAKSTNPPGSDKTVTLKQQMNVQVLEASLTVSLSSGNDSQALLLRSAIDRINEVLAPEFGEDAIQNAAGQDTSAEATAKRILDLSTGFYDAYAAQRPNDDPAQVAEDFVKLIRGGFEQGFAEARDILDGLGVFTDEIKDDVMKTFDLVQKGYDDFLAAKLTNGGLNPESEEPASTSRS